MSWRKKVDPKSDKAYLSLAFANWLAQLASMTMTRFFYLVAGRGSSKTTEFQVERLLEMVYDMPGAPVAWVSDTYANLQKNVLPMVLEGLERKGYKEGVHFVIEKAPPVYTAAETANLPENLRENFWRPYNKLATYKHTMIFFTGLNVTFGSLDRPASLAGRSYVHVFGDEVKYFKEEKIANLLKAVRGYRVRYGNSVFYRGHTFTTDMPNTGNIGEYDWILKQGRQMDKRMILLLLKTAFIVNDVAHEYVAALEDRDTEDAMKKKKTLERWTERLYDLRMQKEAHTFFFIASSYVNVDILTPEWFADAFESQMSDVKTAIMSIRPSLEGGQRFYAAMTEQHFYRDGADSAFGELFGLRDEEDCRILRYLNRNRSLDVSLDFGNMISCTVAQDDGHYYRCLKTLFTLSPEWIRELCDKFLRYFEPHKQRVINLYYDRAGNNYHKAGQDLATQFKRNMEFDKAGKRTGWKVLLMSQGQGNIAQTDEYVFMMELFGGHNPALPKVRIDAYNCKPLKCSLELTPTRINEQGQVVKDKRSEKLPIHRLPYESSNFSDSFKYLMMRRSWIRVVRGLRKVDTGTLTVR